MGQFILGIVAMVIAGLILLKVEYGKLPPSLSTGAQDAEQRAADYKRQWKAEQEAEEYRRRLETVRIEKENQAREKALRIQKERARQEGAQRQRRQQAEADRRSRQEYVDNYRRTHHGCDPGTNRYCTYVQGQPVGCSCM